MTLTVTILAAVAAAALLLRWLFRRVVREFVGPRWLIWISLVLAGAGVLLVVVQSQRLEEHRAQQFWPTAEGLVTDSHVVENRSYHPKVIYEYEVAGQQYEGVSSLMVPGFGGKRKRDEVARKEIAAYWPGRTVTVYYNPDNPSRSQLDTRLPWSVYGQLGFGGTLFFLGVLLSIWPRRRNEASE